MRQGGFNWCFEHEMYTMLLDLIYLLIYLLCQFSCFFAWCVHESANIFLTIYPV